MYVCKFSFCFWTVFFLPEVTSACGHIQIVTTSQTDRSSLGVLFPQFMRFSAIIRHKDVENQSVLFCASVLRPLTNCERAPNDMART